MTPPFDPARPRDLGQLTGDGVRVWRAHFFVLFALALVIVAPVELLVDGLWAGTLDEFGGGDAALGPSIASELSRALIIPVLVTTMHAHAVQDLAAGRAPSITRSTNAAFRMAPG